MQNLFQNNVLINVGTHTCPQFLSCQNVPWVPINKSSDSFPQLK